MIRLTKSNEEDETELSRKSGSLKIYLKNNWLQICFKNWGRVETEVVCKQLGFREGAASLKGRNADGLLLVDQRHVHQK
ncbi:hypothetical protein DPMN_172965 [Dreissena polymorpha]|uniref:SRCR domain-containing protein n=1 Tax=Dreissena polymorpha TaxID=45954 RepID=A0A9D4E0Q7_DREPO|nr:hypothetical protein DPMN_172965 [Dreissena polymorpha]